MAARFEVRRSLVLEDRSLFGLAGVIREGMVQLGMRAALEGDEERFRRTVHSVEYAGVEGSDAAEPVLLFSYSRPDRLEAWKAIPWEGRTLRLEW